jgi:uncharacterized membrane protein HdeD (DUF308 family)
MFLDKYLNQKASTPMIIGGIIAIMIGAVLIVASYMMLSPIVNDLAAHITPAMNASISNYGPPGFITALEMGGIMLIIAGITLVVYPLISLGGTAGEKR